jgi:hypothetical protein
MDKYKVRDFEGRSNELLRRQNFYTLSLPLAKLEGALSPSEIATICRYDEVDPFLHAEDGKDYLKFKKYFIIGSLDECITHVTESVDFLCKIYGEDLEMKYAIIVIKFILDVFEEDELDELTQYDDIDRHKGHVRFYKDFVRMKSLNLKGLRNKFNYTIQEVLDRI